MSYHPFKIQRLNSDTEEWTDVMRLHALKVNKSGGSESFSAGREQYKPRLTFEVRWSKALEAVRWNTQEHRIMYRGHPFNILDFDDYMEQHITIRLTGEAYGC